MTITKKLAGKGEEGTRMTMRIRIRIRIRIEDRVYDKKKPPAS